MRSFDTTGGCWLCLILSLFVGQQVFFCDFLELFVFVCNLTFGCPLIDMSKFAGLY